MEHHRFIVGTFDCLSVQDATAVYPATKIFANAPPHELRPLLRPYSSRPDEVPGPYTCLVINTGRNQVLVDTGAGGLTPTSGRLPRNLRAAGIEPADIDVVILTHGHPDHIGGNVDDEGRQLFPNARYVMWQDEWEFWTSETNLRALPDSWAGCARRNLTPLRKRIALVDRDVEIVPGVSAVFAPGHTLGHMAVAIASGGERLLYMSDAALHPVLMERPDWHSVYDMDRVRADATMRRLCDQAAMERTMIHAFHFPFPNLGYVARRGSGWQWQPLGVGKHDTAAALSPSGVVP